ncbi:MAG: restriction endonuclease subunit S [Bacteroidota bacterium]
MRRVKEAVHLEDDTEYKQVTISLNHGGVKLRGTKHGHEIKTKRQYRTSAGHFILSRIDARNAAFGIVPPELKGAIITNDFWTFEIDEALVSREYFHLFTRTDAFLEACVRASTGTTNRQRIREGFFLDYTFDLPPRDEQDRIVARFEEAEAHWLVAQDELERQRDDLILLRQRILDDAMRGRLVPQDPEDEPASVLLERIAAEKERLVKAGTIRRAKKLPPVSAEEQPYDLPPSWEWVRLISLLREGLSNGRSVKTRDGGFPVLRLTALGGQTVDTVESKPGDWDESEARQFVIQENDFLIARGNGSLSLVGRGSLVAEVLEPVAFPDTMIRIRVFSDACDPVFLFHLWNSSLVRKQIETQARSTSGLHKINQGHVRNITVPLPPFEEQRRIVDLIDELLTVCDALEARLEAARADAEALMQAVLREAFVGGEPVAS